MSGSPVRGTAGAPVFGVNQNSPALPGATSVRGMEGPSGNVGGLQPIVEVKLPSGPSGVQTTGNVDASNINKKPA